MVENVEVLRMTGAELKLIWVASKLEDDQIKPIFGFSRSTLYNRFEDSKVSVTIEAAVDSHLILSQWKNRILNKPETRSSTEPAVNEGTDLAKMLTDTIQLMRDILVKSEKQMDLLAENNKHIREEAELYRRMVMDGYDSGLLQWTKK